MSPLIQSFTESCILYGQRRDGITLATKKIDDLHLSFSAFYLNILRMTQKEVPNFLVLCVDSNH